LAVNWLNEQSVVENLAVGDKEGELVLNLLKDYVGSSSVLPIKHTAAYMKDKMYIERAEAITVKATSIDHYCKTHDIKSVELIKMDIEGFEDKAYEGMHQTVKASPNLTLFIEFTKDSYAHPKAFYDQMVKDFGHVYVIDDEGYIVQAKDLSYKAVIGDADDWVMPIFSKKANLATR
jgi:FkbM family methyltransferase